MSRAVIGVLIVFAAAHFAWAKVGGGDILYEQKAGNVTFSHDSHVGLGMKCTDCHDALFGAKGQQKPASMAQMQKGQSCGACHDGTKAFSVKGSCKSCHKK